jgi:quinol monooxygenase YgiN
MHERRHHSTLHCVAVEQPQFETKKKKEELEMKKLTLLAAIVSLSAAVVSAYADSSGPNGENDMLSANAPATPDFVLFSSVKVKPESIINFKSAVLPYAEQTRREDGCLEYRVHQSPDDPTQFETYEHWKSDDARQAHLAASYTVQFFSTTSAFFEPGYPSRQKFIELR